MGDLTQIRCVGIVWVHFAASNPFTKNIVSADPASTWCFLFFSYRRAVLLVSMLCMLTAKTKVVGAMFSSEGALEQFGAATTTNGQVGQPHVLLRNIPFKAVAAASFNVLALASNGSAYQWGKYGTISIGTVPTNDTVKYRLLGAIFTSISAGVTYMSTCTSQGGITITGSLNVPTYPSSMNYIQGQCKAVAAGSVHMVALLRNGTVVAWGTVSAQAGQKDVPAAVISANITSVAAGSLHSLALSNDGAVYVFGSPVMLPRSPITGAKAIASAPDADYSLARKWVACHCTISLVDCTAVAIY
jgi:alpha-tubulin suppressor-like RCC1 family protein